jgi:hypothetical protein
LWEETIVVQGSKLSEYAVLAEVKALLVTETYSSLDLTKLKAHQNIISR